MELAVSLMYKSFLFMVYVGVPFIVFIIFISKSRNFTKAKRLVYCGFSIFFGTVCGIYGLIANRFRFQEIFLLIDGGIIAGIAIAIIFCGIVSLLKEQK